MAGAAVFGFADGFGIGGGSTTGAAGGTASAAEMWAESGSWTFEVWVICATVRARRFEQLHQALMGDGTHEGEARK